MSLIAATLFILASAGQGASQPATAKPPETTESHDPMVCESSEQIGSRLRRKRVCMRRSEWERQKQENKQMIERTQVQRGIDSKG